MALIPPQPIGVLPGSGYWNDWIEKIRDLINGLQQGLIIMIFKTFRVGVQLNAII
jgi:hypothetical protein